MLAKLNEKKSDRELEREIKNKNKNNNNKQRRRISLVEQHNFSAAVRKLEMRW